MKKILALALALIMILACAVTAFAEVDEREVKNLYVTGFFAERTGSLLLKNGETLKFSFVNQSNGSDNWNNFIMAVVGENHVDAAQEILIVRADAWGWGGGMSDLVAPDAPEGNKLAFTSAVNWDNFMAEMKEGAKVEITLTKNGNTLEYAAKINENTVNLTATSGVNLPENVYVFLTGDNCTLLDIRAYVNGAEVAVSVPTPPATEEPETSEPEESVPETTEKKEEDYPKITGNLTVGGFFSNRTDAIPLKDGEGYTFNFHMTSTGPNNWDTFILAVIGDNHAGADQEALIVRGDNWGWGGGLSDFVAPDQSGNALKFESNIDWDKWVSTCKSGVNVTVYVSRVGNALLYEARIGSEWFVKLNAYSGKALPENLYVFFTGENVTLSNITTKAGNPITADTSMPFAFIGLAVVAATAVVVLEKKRRMTV